MAKSPAKRSQGAENTEKRGLGPLANVGQVTKALGRVIRAMWDEEIETQDGARIANALGIMRACLETATLERIEQKLDDLGRRADRNWTPNGHLMDRLTESRREVH